MATPASSGQRRDLSQPRAQPPIRWPHPTRADLSIIALWTVGIVVALFVPALIVAPTATNPPTGRVLLALGSTLLGSAVMLTSASLLWRRTSDASVLLLGAVPAISCVVGGIILTATKLAGR